MSIRSGSDVAVGDAIGSVERTPTRVGLFLFGVAHWTAHRIHYDSDWARAEGHQDVLVPGPLMSAWLADLVAAWAGSPTALVAMTDRNVSSTVPGEPLTVDGEVTAVDGHDDGATVTCEVRVRAGDRLVVTGSCTVRLPA